MPTSILLRADQVIEEACLLQRMSLFLARNGPKRSENRCLLSGVERPCRAGGGTSGFDPTATSPLRHPGHAQALIHALAPSKEIRIVAEPGSTEAANGEAWIER